MKVAMAATVNNLEGRANRMKPITASLARREEFAELAGLLAGREGTLKVLVEGEGARDLPVEAGVLLERLLILLGRGDGVSVVGVPEELTTQQAADLLNVSRQYLVRLLDAGEIPSRRTNSHRRVQSADVLEYKASRDAKRRKRLRKLTHLAEELGGYETELKAS